MDYKSQNPQPPTWTFDEFLLREPEPYDVRTCAGLFEIDSPDLSTVILLENGFICDDGESMILYAIEASRECPMRRAFEWGEITWHDYWSHKGWLFRIKFPFNPGPVTSTYIAPSQMDVDTLKRMKGLEGRYPYGLKLQQLELRCQSRSIEKNNRERAEREYQKFMVKYGHRFSQDSA
jgi:hypothetical protein